MGKDKFDILNNDDAIKVVAKASLEENRQISAEFVKILLTNFPKALKDQLKEKQKTTGESVNSFIRRATVKLATEERII